MLSQPISVQFNLDEKRQVTLGTGKLARQADGAVTVQQGNCIIMATVVANKDPKDGQDFFPLSVDYQEKFASAGRVPGSFFKREARLNDYEILTSRLIDRALRPLFPEDYLCDVQVLVSLISSDSDILPDSLACLAASAALAVSDIPIKEIISEVRIARVNGQFIINPTRTELANSDLEFLIAATEKNLMMVEGEAKECAEADLVKALEIAHDAIRIQIKAQAELRAKAGVTTKRDYKKPEQDEQIKELVYNFAKDRVYEISRKGSAKHERSDAYSALKDEIMASLPADVTDLQKKLAKKYYEDLKWEVVRNMILEDRIRLDGRKLDEVRPLAMEVEPLPTPHGSALFTRGETQSLTTVTFGTKLDELLAETAAKSEYSKFFLHYNFPPFSTGEVKMMRGVGRREVGHGNLAQRSLKQMMPSSTEFAYTVRIVSDILESNGSSSMASVCGSTMSLMDAGVPLKAMVAGVAMGMIYDEESGKYEILADIQAQEDFLGDMDFKVARTEKGITALQMDCKIAGLSMDVIRSVFEKSVDATGYIMGEMRKCLSEPRKELSPFAPFLLAVFVPEEKMREVIGKGGETIQKIEKDYGVEVNLEDDGQCTVTAKTQEAGRAALEFIKGILKDIEVGDEYEGKIVKILDTVGAIVEISKGKEGMIHISKFGVKERIANVNDVAKEGEIVKVRVYNVDKEKGRIGLEKIVEII